MKLKELLSMFGNDNYKTEKTKFNVLDAIKQIRSKENEKKKMLFKKQRKQIKGVRNEKSIYERN